MARIDNSRKERRCLNEGEKMFKKSNYDFEIYKELRKLNETINMQETYMKTLTSETN